VNVSPDVPDHVDDLRVVPWRRRIVAGDARRAWQERRGWLVVVERDGVRGIGEASPLPGFGDGGGGGAGRGDGGGGDGDSPDDLAAAAAIRFGLETAMMDLESRRRGVPLADLLAPSPAARVPVNAVVADAVGAAAAVARGIATLKLKVGGDHARTLATVRAIAAAAPGAALRLDANQSWPLDEVERRLAELAALAVAIEYVEEPAAGLAARLAARGTSFALPVALDESLAASDRAWLDAALASGAVAAIVLKPTVLGGLEACLALAARARAHGVDAVVTHALDGPVAAAAAAELARALSPARAVGLDHHVTLDAWPVRAPQLVDGAVVAAAAPGLGLDIDALLAAAEPS
jgi:o-succinylbenzoate synthase